MFRAAVLFFALQPFAMFAAAPAKPDAPQVYRARVTPHWFAHNTRFWYLNHLPDDGREFIVVDADRGTREPAFEQQRVATELAKVLGREVRVNHLPIRSLTFDEDGGTVVLLGDVRSWRLNLATYALSPGPDVPDNPVDLNPRPSSRTGPSTEIVFENALHEDLDIFWMAPDGSRMPYGSVKAGGRRPQQTYTGHVWVVTKHDGTLVGVFEAAEGGTSAKLSDRALRPGNGKTNGDTGDMNPRPSSRTGPSTEIVFVNPLHEELYIFWMAPDGSRVPYGSVTAGGQRSQQTFAGHVWVVSKRDGSLVGVFEATEGGTRAMLEERSTPGAGATKEASGSRDEDFAPFKSPNGKWEAFVRDDNLWVRNVASAHESQLSTDGTPGDTYHEDHSRSRMIWLEYSLPDAPPSNPDVKWAPDSKRLVAYRTHLVPERRVSYIESSPSDQLQPKLQSYPYLKAGDDIPLSTPHLFSVDTLQQTPISNALFPTPWSTDAVRWAPDSSQFTFLYNQRGHQTLRLVAVDAQSGTATAVVDERSETFIDYKSGIFTEFLDPTHELIWMSERDGWRHLYLYDSKAGQVKNQITHGDWVVNKVLRVDPERRQIWFLAGGIRPEGEPYYLDLCRVNFDGGGLVILTNGVGTHSVEMSPDNRFLIDTWSRVDLPPVSEVREAESGKLVCRLEESDASEVLAANGSFPERFAAKGRDGSTDIYGVIYRPKNFDPTKSYPVIESIYAGPHAFYVPKSFQTSYWWEDLVNCGFIVVQIDGMGTAGRSKQFHDVCWKNLADAGLPDRIAWLRAAAAKHPEMDLRRVGIFGTSAGGQSALAALLWHGDFYKVGVADSGCHDNRMDKIWWNEQWMGWPVGPQYAENSNVTHAMQLQGKLMLLVGELDRNVDPASTMQVVNALVKADKNFELVVVPGAGHGVLGTPYGWRRMREFFSQNLVPAAAIAR
jgi:dipeptidyl aminopeptidase/acylaminoacyl peptidase